jgi:hypothetical protein
MSTVAETPLIVEDKPTKVVKEKTQPTRVSTRVRKPVLKVEEPKAPPAKKKVVAKKAKPAEKEPVEKKEPAPTKAAATKKVKAAPKKAAPKKKAAAKKSKKNEE